MTHLKAIVLLAVTVFSVHLSDSKPHYSFWFNANPQPVPQLPAPQYTYTSFPIPIFPPFSPRPLYFTSFFTITRHGVNATKNTTSYNNGRSYANTSSISEDKQLIKGYNVTTTFNTKVTPITTTHQEVKNFSQRQTSAGFSHQK